MKIGELSLRTGVSVRMLRYYEAEGLLHPERTASGQREFDPHDVEAVARIRFLAEAGFTLDLIRQFLPCLRSDRASFEACEELRLVLRDQLTRTDAAIRQLAARRRTLANFLSSVEGGSQPAVQGGSVRA